MGEISKELQLKAKYWKDYYSRPLGAYIVKNGQRVSK